MAEAPLLELAGPGAAAGASVAANAALMEAAAMRTAQVTFLMSMMMCIFFDKVGRPAWFVVKEVVLLVFIFCVLGQVWGRMGSWQGFYRVRVGAILGKWVIFGCERACMCGFCMVLGGINRLVWQMLVGQGVCLGGTEIERKNKNRNRK